MPKDKDLKRLIRARMRKTGESYTTARAHVVSSHLRPLPEDHERLAGASDDAVREATGMGWVEWAEALDRLGADSMDHRAIAAHVAERYPVSEWWSQMVTVAYERFRGLRDVGQGRDGQYAVSRSRTVPVGVDRLWEAVEDPAERGRWLPETPLETRTANPPKSIRWTLDDGTRLDAYFTDKGEGRSTLTLQHRKLPDREAADRAKAFWADRLTGLAQRLRAEG